MGLTDAAKTYHERMFPGFKIISQCIPFIGYPRSLNALRCVNEAAAKSE
ncbi:hypothetical protein [Paenibacillus sp. FSL R5-0345]|nr:hypothetical protein [Paenibacillus sp. FSL R5-0345]